MIRSIQRAALPVFLAVTALGAHAQYLKLHGASISVGATSPYDETITSNPTPVTARVGFPGFPSVTTPVTVSNQQQFTTSSVGFISSLQFHPKPWAGVELNYGFSHYSERYTFNYGAPFPAANRVSVPVDAHEMTAAYQFHPRHIPFQPFVNVGGGSIAFVNAHAPNQFRGAGLLEAGFDVPTHNSHIGFRIEGRSLYYRAPNFYTSAISTRTWRATVEPSVSTYYRF